MSATADDTKAGRYDHAVRRRSRRRGREKGCWVYIPEAELPAGYETNTDDGGAPFYRIWGSPRGRLVVQLYKTRTRFEGGGAK